MGRFRVSDGLSLAILGLCCGGTFIGLALTSVAKKAGQTGPPPKPDWPWLQDTQAPFEERLQRLDAAQAGQQPQQQKQGAAANGASSGSSKPAS